MIDIQIEGTKKKTWEPVVVGSQVKTLENVVGDIMAESVRRENLVRKLYSECPYRPGDTVVPSNSDLVKQYGEKIMVLSIVDTYAKFGKNEKWPQSDNPLLVTAKSYDKDMTFICSTDFLMKKPRENAAC